MGRCVSGEAEGESELSLFGENVSLQRAGKSRMEQEGNAPPHWGLVFPGGVKLVPSC